MSDIPRAEPTEAVVEARRTRDEVHEAMVGLEQAIAAPAAGRGGDWAADVDAQLVALRRELVDHVEVTEGPDGLFAEVIEHAPRLNHAVDRLRTDHGTLLDVLDGERKRLAALGDDPSGDDLGAAREGLLGLLALLARHRQRGADLVYEAYEVDVGPAD
ncbi:MAG: hypothetical protein IPM45_09945 [Acidimicrobiales bacterium]|nr:hypothetical protein [Acidimicrobiales bacterium]